MNAPIPEDALCDTQPPPSGPPTDPSPPPLAPPASPSPGGHPLAPPVDSKVAQRFIRARNFKPAIGRVATLVVIHSMEAPDSAVTALHVAEWFAGSAAPMASAHYCLDGGGSVIQCVREADVAYAAPGANRQGVHLELAGYAKQTEAQWLADVVLLDRAAELAADVCRRHGIPIAFVDAEGLRAGESGITTHAEVSKAWNQTDHTDPGPSFPLEHFIELVQDVTSGAAVDAL